MNRESLDSVLHRLEMDEELEVLKKKSINLKLLLEMSDSELHATFDEMKLNTGKIMKLYKEIIELKSSK